MDQPEKVKGLGPRECKAMMMVVVMMIMMMSLEISRVQVEAAILTHFC